jgi:hypothetical protein
MFSQPGIFNVLDDWGSGVMRTSGDPLASGTGNASALQAAIQAAQENAEGGIVLIPSYSGTLAAPFYGAYPIDTSLLPGNVITIDGDVPLLICGTGEGTQLSLIASEGENMFLISSTGKVTFQDLNITYTENNHGTAFDFTGNAAHALFRVDIVNCQNPVVFNGTQGARMLQCYFKYNTGITGSIVAVQIGVAGGAATDDTALSQCLFRCESNDVDGFVGILIDGATGVKITDTQVEDFQTGVQIQGTDTTASQVSVVGTRVESLSACLQINPNVFDVSFADCHFQAGAGSIGVPGIGIGNGGGDITNDQIDTVRFMSCSLTGNTGGLAYGMEIGAAQNIQIHGGDYSGNGPTAGIRIMGGAAAIQIIGANCIGLEYEGNADPTPLMQQYGIWITWGTDIQIIGVNCSGNGLNETEYYGDGILIDGSGTGDVVSDVRIIGVSCAGDLDVSSIYQTAGISVKAASNVLVQDCDLSGEYEYGLYLDAVTNVTVRACDLFGNTYGLYIDEESTQVYVRDCNATGYGSYTNAIHVASALTAVEITNCAGYNDVYSPPLSTTIPSGAFSGITVSNYYGPTVFYSVAALLTIDLQPTHLSNGGFTLAPGETAHFTEILEHAKFLMIAN